ncbi:hypothetical protein B0J12DRAFT_343510 [Macrophomina phaseolina]|uniref:Uncharacterized protein n=1 Tax=Macrophomina phaseolina TaxID=35725 RepID=A0ABQ8GM81_9PEZI|nr:hypothetical protein B0J12DRAFT_343510 [Macrophomina phaseolina]
MVDAPAPPQHRCNGSNCFYDADSVRPYTRIPTFSPGHPSTMKLTRGNQFVNHDTATLHLIGHLYLSDIRLLVSHVLDLSSRAARLEPAHRGQLAMRAATRQIAGITAERQVKLGELLDEVVVRRKNLAPLLLLQPPPPSLLPSPPQRASTNPAEPRPPFSPLLALPGEIRTLIYAFCLVPASSCLRPYSAAEKSIAPALLATNRQIHAEATSILYGANMIELDVFQVPRFMFQIADCSRWLRRVRLVGLGKLKVLGENGRGRVVDEVEGWRGRRGVGGSALRRIVARGRGRGRRRGRSRVWWSEEAEGEGVEDGAGRGWEGEGEPLRLQLYLLHRATGLERLEVLWSAAGAEKEGSPKLPDSAEVAARDVFELLYPWLAAVAAARGEGKAAARIVRPFTHHDDRGSEVDRAVFRKRLGMLLKKGLQQGHEAGENTGMG